MKLIMTLKEIKTKNKEIADSLVRRCEFDIFERDVKSSLKFIAVRKADKDGLGACSLKGKTIENLIKNLSSCPYASYECVLVK